MKPIFWLLAAIAVIVAGALVANHEGLLAHISPGEATRDDGLGTSRPGTSSTPSAAASRDAAASKPAPFNLLSLDVGARVESATSEYDAVETPATRLIDSNAAGQWCATTPLRFPQELVFSSLGRQQALVASVLVNPTTDDIDEDRWAKDVEVWSSTESATAGFNKVGSATLARGCVCQSLGVNVSLTMTGSYSSGLTPDTPLKLASKVAPDDGTPTLGEWEPCTAHA